MYRTLPGSSQFDTMNDMDLTGTPTYRHGTTVEGGIFTFNASVPGDITIASRYGDNKSPTLQALGMVGGNVTVAGDGTLSPGQVFTAGTLTCNGDVTFSNGGTFAPQGDIKGNLATLSVGGSVSLGSAKLRLPGLGSLNIPDKGLTIIQAADVNGTFANLPEGATVTNGSQQLKIHYTSNSVVLVAGPTTLHSTRRPQVSDVR
jgi:formylmethanofuran dehydrogenase subunit C